MHLAFYFDVMTVARGRKISSVGVFCYCNLWLNSFDNFKFCWNYELKIPTYQRNTMNQCLISIQNQNTLKCSFYFFIALWFYENSKILCEETAAIQYRMLHLIFFFGMVISGMLLLNVTQIRFYLDKFFIFVLLNGSYYWQYECNYTFL